MMYQIGNASIKTLIYKNPIQTHERSLYPTAYTFDKVFRCDCSTRLVYEEGAKEVALSVVSGINSSIFAYGQTSSGKTYTMCGVSEFTVADIYEYMERHKEREFLLKFSALEIYNESVRDLLGADSTPLRLLDDPDRGTVVDKLKEETLRDWNHFKELLYVCKSQKQIGDTSLDETNSRSHQILRLTVESSASEFVGNNSSSILTATVNFVDLAGSDCASQAVSAGAKLREGSHINHSLLTFESVVRKLSKESTGHIPFRDSKLTRILQSTLSGNARTAIICTISPARSHVEQSRNTLLFASRAKEATTNALMSDKALARHWQGESARPEGELRPQGPTPIVSDLPALLREKDVEIEELKKEVKEVTLQRERLILLQEHLILQQEQLTLQRDLAHSQLKDLLRIVGTDRNSVVSENDDNQYPQLRVRRNEWVPETPIAAMPSCNVWEPETPACTEIQRPYLSVRNFDASQYSDGHSRSNSEDNYLQFSDNDESFERDASPLPSCGIPTYVGTHTPEEELCKEVRCIETEEPTKNGEQNIALPVVARIDDGEEVSQELESPSLENEEKSKHINPVSVRDSGDTLFPWGTENDEEVYPKLEPPSSADGEKLKHINPISVIESSDKLFPMVSKGKSIKLSKSRSCQEFFITSSPCYWSKKEENDKSVESSCYCKWSNNNTPVTGTEELPKLKENPLVDDEVKEAEVKSSKDAGSGPIQDEAERSSKDVGSDPIQNESKRSSKDVGSDPIHNEPKNSSKDVGSDPIIDKPESMSKWVSESGNIQREIFELWNECNVPLVHRTYFFLQLKGNPKESIYMEVELKRLSILKESFSHENQNAEHAESIKDLRRERQWLSKLMKKKLSELDRQTLYLNWGIGLNTKDRRLQLAHRVWTDTEDIGHIIESAKIVEKLAGTARPEPAFKDMFGIYFASPRRSTSWKFY